MPTLTVVPLTVVPRPHYVKENVWRNTNETQHQLEREWLGQNVTVPYIRRINNSGYVQNKRARGRVTIIDAKTPRAFVQLNESGAGWTVPICDLRLQTASEQGVSLWQRIRKCLGL